MAEEPRPQPKPGSIVHVEFHVKEPKKVEKFYGSLFGWKFQEVPGLSEYYSLFEAPSGPGGGVGGVQPMFPTGIINYIGVSSVDEYTKKIENAGGKITLPKTEVPGQGWFAVFEDPAGTRMALWQQNPQAAQPPPEQRK